MWPSITNILWPFEHPAVAGLGGGQARPRSKSHRPVSSVMARVAMVSPEAMPGSRSFLAASSPEVSRALAARATVEKYGAHSRAAPISSSTTMSST